ncbi:MAG: MOSC domain-containing protein [Gammaproteobacteria bacterium]|nr:MOSC domain-containing protein [Gammaproteobacteria bacterium]
MTLKTQITSVNVAEARIIPGAEEAGLSGIYKAPVTGPVAVSAAGLENDAICHTEHHGGADQAVYMYGSLDYDWWAAELGHAIAPGAFGENLTINGLDSNLNAGDRLAIGSVVLEATAPRIPCGNFAARMGDAGFAKSFRSAERPGVYFRVAQAGTLQAGDEVTLTPASGEVVSIMELFHAYYDPNPDPSTLRRHLAAPIAERLRARKQAQLEKLG